MNKKIKFRVNGKRVELDVPTNRLLVDCLRYDLGLTGTKEGCSVGVCGACTVLMDGDMISSCLTLAVMVDGHDITTVEGLAKLRAVFAARGFRPVETSDLPAEATTRFAPLQLFTIDDVFGGWDAAQSTHFADGGIFDALYQHER